MVPRREHSKSKFEGVLVYQLFCIRVRLRKLATFGCICQSSVVVGVSSSAEFGVIEIKGEILSALIGERRFVPRYMPFF